MDNYDIETTFSSNSSNKLSSMQLHLRQLNYGEIMKPTDLWLDMWGELHVKGKVRFFYRKYSRGYAKHFRIVSHGYDFKMIVEKNF